MFPVLLLSRIIPGVQIVKAFVQALMSKILQIKWRGVRAGNKVRERSVTLEWPIQSASLHVSSQLLRETRQNHFRSDRGRDI